MTSPLSKSLQRETFYFGMLKFLRLLSYPHKRTRSILGNLLNNSGVLQASVRKLFPDIEIIHSGHIDNLYIFFKKTDNPVFISCDDWKRKRVASFLLINIKSEIEHIVLDYVEAFYAFGDEHCEPVQKWLMAITRKQQRIVVGILKTLSLQNAKKGPVRSL